MKLELPAEVIDTLGPEPERKVLEAVLLFLVAKDRVSVAYAGEVLGLDRLSAVRWYTGHGFLLPGSLRGGPGRRFAPCPRVLRPLLGYVS